MKTLIPALQTKWKNNQNLKLRFADRFFRIFNPGDPSLLTTVNEFPFVGIAVGSTPRNHEGSQMVYEALRVNAWIYEQLFGNEEENVEALLNLQDLLQKEAEYDIDFEGTEYEGSEIIEAWCIFKGEPEPFQTEQHPQAARILTTFEYQRSIEVDL